MLSQVSTDMDCLCKHLEAKAISNSQYFSMMHEILDEFFILSKCFTILSVVYRIFILTCFSRLYPVDKTRVNEYGMSYETEESTEQKRKKE